MSILKFAEKGDEEQGEGEHDEYVLGNDEPEQTDKH